MSTSTLSTPLTNNITATFPKNNVSSITDPSPHRAKHPPPIVPQVRKTTGGTQRTIANKTNLYHHDKTESRAATTLLDTERKKTYGMGARKVASQIIADWQVDVSFLNLSRYVTEGNIDVISFEKWQPMKNYTLDIPNPLIRLLVLH